jgi:lysophospholipase L1-like esterase
MTTKTLLKKTVNVTAYIIVVFIFQEALFRFCFPVPEIKNFDRVNYMKIYLDGTSSLHNRNITRSWTSLPDTQSVFIHKMNKYAFRDREWYINKPQNKKRAIFIGDSFVEGVMANHKETIPEAFKNASKNKNYEVFNAGMIGCGLDSYLQLTADIVPLFKPDVIFVCIYANDLGKHQPIVPSHYLDPIYYDSYTPRLFDIYTQAKTNSNIPFRWNNRTNPYISATPDNQNPWATFEDFLSPHVQPWIATEMKKANLNPFLTNSLAKEEKYLKEQPPIGETLPFLQHTCNQQSTKLVIVYIPSRNQVSNHYLQFEKQYCISCPDSIDLTTKKYQAHQRFIEKQCQEFNIPFIDLSSTIKEEEEKGNHLYWNYDQHMRAKGYKIVGETIRKNWESHY